MSNPNKRKGDKAELDLVKWLQENTEFTSAQRTRAGWDDDMGDINLDPGYRQERFIDVKNHKTLQMNSWLDSMDAKILSMRKHFDDGIIVVKRPGLANPGDWWAVRTVRREFRGYEL